MLNNSSKNILERISTEQCWSEESEVRVLTDFIDKMAEDGKISRAEFLIYLSDRQDEENKSTIDF